MKKKKEKLSHNNDKHEAYFCSDKNTLNLGHRTIEHKKIYKMEKKRDRERKLHRSV